MHTDQAGPCELASPVAGSWQGPRGGDGSSRGYTCKVGACQSSPAAPTPFTAPSHTRRWHVLRLCMRALLSLPAGVSSPAEACSSCPAVCEPVLVEGPVLDLAAVLQVRHRTALPGCAMQAVQRACSSHPAIGVYLAVSSGTSQGGSTGDTCSVLCCHECVMHSSSNPERIRQLVRSRHWFCTC